ncbi:phosphatidylserine synthase, putative [Plasmodium ovale wallikeri]|uniref:Phosphatidylserine synthase, putative n=1 Tax=Plasmodium ovale wallikeri TaxID=864142 RepID=A0A1A8YZ01_PLAOA|nr:phosphatidylserine synthase, putative [Plasmodium ovale wallikeri]SBT37385.1 phosphatidylserine synthase, putative [Plasmodium ovale wallikeri]
MEISSVLFFLNILSLLYVFTKHVISIHKDIITLTVVLFTSCYYPVLLFLNYYSTDEIRWMLRYVNPHIQFHPVENNYMENCYTLDSVMDKFDIFVIAHFCGWFVKTLAIRDFFILNINSVMFELIELKFQHLLPNFYECWWDHLYDWTISLKNKPNKKNIIFPALDRLLRKMFKNSISMLVQIFLCFIMNLSDLNIFFLKAQLQFLPTSYIVYMREAFVILITLNAAIHFYYSISKEINIKRVLYIITTFSILSLELLLSIRWRHNLTSDNSDTTNINIFWLCMLSTVTSAFSLLFVNDYIV